MGSMMTSVLPWSATPRPYGVDMAGDRHEQPSTTVWSRVLRVMVVLIAGPLVLAGAAVAAWALLGQFLSGWVPSEWIVVPSDGATLVDSFFGATKGSGRRFVNLLAGALVATAGASVISSVWRR